MSQTKNRTSKLLVLSVILGDLLIMNALFAALYYFWPQWGLGTVFSGGYFELAAFNTICYIMSTYYNGVVLHLRNTRNVQIVQRVTKNCIKFAALSIALISLAGYDGISTRFFILFHLTAYIALIIWRIVCYHIVQNFRKNGRNLQFCIFLGSSSAVRELYREMQEISTGYRVYGYFDDEVNPKMPAEIPYLGKVEEAIDFINNHQRINIYSSLPSSQSELILKVIYWSEQTFSNFFHVPHVRNYLQRRMWLETVGDVPVLRLHITPLDSIDNRFVKRAFDLIASGLFLFTIFPFIYIIVGGIIKITSPGPIFFKQKRNGINGKEFWCYKFRSMKVNKDADKIQATKNDPRKTKFGDFMRKTNIDELPQLINVFLGDMSLVGPRPHMVKHTEEYSQLISTYMVRHFVKPGITGWAQVTGFRGETKELHQMEGRVDADIWYMEHWSFTLDLYIIYRTFANVIQGEKNAY